MSASAEIHPYKGIAYWKSFGHDFWLDFGLHNVGIGSEIMEGAERLLLDQEKEREDVLLVNPHRWGGWLKTPFHSVLLPNWEAFAEAQTNSNSLQTFRINNVFLPPSPFFEQKLVPIFTNNINLTSLELRSCGLEPSEIAVLARFIENNSSLSILDLSVNKMDCVEASISLSLAMKTHVELCFVNFSQCNLGENPAVLSAILDGCKGLKSLIVDDNGIFNGNGVGLVAEFLSSSKTITLFSMANNVNQPNYKPNYIGDDQVKLLSRSLKKNPSLCHLCLGSNRLHIPSFLSNWRVTENLTQLDLNGNNIRTPGAKIIAAFLSQNQTLEDLDLSRNRINSLSASLIGNALKKNTTLRHFNLSRNNLCDKAVHAFVDALKYNRTLLSLDLSGNAIKVTSGRKELTSAICDTSSLSCIANSSNHTCQLVVSSGKSSYMNHLTHEEEMKLINGLDNEGQKIRYKVVLALFVIKKDLFNPRNFVDVPLELMPYLLEIAQQDVGYRGFGVGIVKSTKKHRVNGLDPTLNRLYNVVMGWDTPLLVLVS